MVMTKKFSEFTDADLTESDNVLVGLSGGANAKSSKIVSWTTATRPSPPLNGLIGYNTDLQEYEFYNSSIPAWVQLLTSVGGMNWSEITAVSVNANVNNGYAANRPATPVNIVLPATCALGDDVAVMGKGAGGWSLVANVGQTIIFGNQTSSVAGAISSSHQSDNILVTCLVDNLVWQVRYAVGNLTVI